MESVELRKIRAQAQLNENTVEKWKLENDKELNTSIWLMAGSYPRGFS